MNINGNGKRGRPRIHNYPSSLICTVTGKPVKMNYLQYNALLSRSGKNPEDFAKTYVSRKGRRILREREEGIAKTAKKQRRAAGKEVVTTYKKVIHEALLVAEPYYAEAREIHLQLKAARLVVSNLRKKMQTAKNHAHSIVSSARKYAKSRVDAMQYRSEVIASADVETIDKQKMSA